MKICCILVIVIVAVIAIAAVVFAQCDVLTDSIEATTLVSHYKQSAAAADKDYKNQTYKITGTITRVWPVNQDQDDAYADMRVGDWLVRFQFAAHNLFDVDARLPINSDATIKGRIAGLNSADSDALPIIWVVDCNIP